MDEKEIKKMLEESMTRVQNGAFDFSKDWGLFFFIMCFCQFNPKENVTKNLGGLSNEQR